jgi:site-specific recombinase XerD
VLWEEPLAGYMASLRAASREEGTVTQRRWHLTRLAETYADPWNVTTTDLERFMSRSDWGPEYKRAIRSAFRSFYRWAEREGHVGTNPAEPLDSIRLRRAVPRPTPDDAVSHALSRADDRVALAITIALYTGLRRAEIAQVHSRDIHEDNLVVHGKGGHERLVPLHPELGRQLRAELRRRREGAPVGNGWGLVVPPEDGWLFPSSHGGHLTPHHLGKLITDVLPDGWTTHTLRHRFATQAYQVARDLRAVQELLGHVKPETTARYAAVPTGALREAVYGIHPTHTPDLPERANRTLEG